MSGPTLSLFAASKNKALSKCRQTEQYLFPSDRNNHGDNFEQAVCSSVNILSRP